MNGKKLTALQWFRLQWDTVKYFNIRQIGYRLIFIAKRKICFGLGHRLAELYYQAITRKAFAKIHISPVRLLSGNGQIAQFVNDNSLREKILDNAAAILDGRFTINHQTRVMEPVGWHDPDQSLLWNLNLHYFEYALDLGLAYRLSAGEDKRYYRKFKSLVLDWIGANPIGLGNGWNGYAVSVRSGVWMILYEIFEVELAADPGFRELFLSQIIKQALFVARNLEFDVRGNHLLKNLKALILAGQFLSGGPSRKWMSLAGKLLLCEIKQQILTDGGHFERSTMYHCQVCQDLLEIYLALTRDGNVSSPLAVLLKDTILKMAEFLLNQLHPDGTMALFGDSALGVTANPMDLIAVVSSVAGCGHPIGDYRLKDPYLFLIGGHRVIPGPHHSPDLSRSRISQPEIVSFNDSGYFMVRNRNNDYLVVDGGVFGPESLPAHSHCDMLSYELSLSGERFIVDSGVLEYAPNQWRDYFRGTSAHNTVMVDGIEQARCWGSFRVGKRARRISAALELDRDGNPVFKGAIDLTPMASFRLIQQREIMWIGNRLWLVMDSIHSDGPAIHSLQSFIHFEKNLHAIFGQNQIRVYKNSVWKATLWPFWTDEVRIQRGRTEIPQGYCAERFGRLEENDVAVLVKTMNSQHACFGYLIGPPDGTGSPIEISGGNIVIDGFRAGMPFRSTMDHDR